MSDSLRNRLFGGALLGLGLVGVLASPDVSEGVEMVFSFAAGGALGAGAALVMTGEPLWASDRWQPSA